MSTLDIYHIKFLPALIRFVNLAIRHTKTFLDVEEYVRSQIIGVVLKKDGSWSQNVSCAACPGAQWPGCERFKVLPTTTNYNFEKYEIASKSHICLDSIWAADIDGNGIFATVFNNGGINHMDCVGKLQNNYPMTCSPNWFAVDSNTGRCLCVRQFSNCSSLVMYAPLYGLYKRVRWRKGANLKRMFMTKQCGLGHTEMGMKLCILR